MLAKAVAEVLKKHPIINAAYVEGGIKYNKGMFRIIYIWVYGNMCSHMYIYIYYILLFFYEFRCECGDGCVDRRRAYHSNHHQSQ
jgi:hypothetical protein